MDRFLPAILLALCSFALGCPESGSSEGSRIADGYYEDGSFVFGSRDASTQGAPSDAAPPFPPCCDAGVGASDGGIDAGDVSDAGEGDSGPTDMQPSFVGDCSIESCGAAPISSFVCFDGETARIECSRVLDGACTWQFVCGL